jgi:hypothetical protein
MVHVFCTWILCVKNIYDTHISRMKYFQLLQNIAFYLYVHHMCFKHITFVCKKHKLMKLFFGTIFIIKSWDEKFVMHAYSSYKCFNTLHLYRSLGGCKFVETYLICFFATWFRMSIKDFFWVYIFSGTKVKVSNEFLILGWKLILMLMQKTMFCDISCTKKHS